MFKAVPLIACALAVSTASSGIYEVDSFHLGGFYAAPEMAPPLIPDNDPVFQNYFMGHTTVSGFTTTERRTFFAFDLSGILIPDGEEIVSATFTVELLFGGVIANFTGGVEHVSFTSTSSSYDAIADPMGAGMAPEEIFDTLGTGTEYTGFDIVDMGTPPGLYSLDMTPTALGDIEASMDMDEIFVMSGKLDTYDPAMAAAFEFVFGLSDVVTGGMPSGMPVPKLTIETAPIPAPSGLALLGIAGALGTRRRR